MNLYYILNIMDNSKRVVARGSMSKGLSSYSYYQDRKEQYKQYYLKRVRQQEEERIIGDYYVNYWRLKLWQQKAENKIIDISNNETN